MTIYNISFLPGSSSFSPYGVTDTDLIYGELNAASSSTGAVFDPSANNGSGAFTEYSYPGATYNWVVGITASGTIVGNGITFSSDLSSETYDPFYYSNGTYVSLASTLPNTEAIGASPNGTVYLTTANVVNGVSNAYAYDLNTNAYSAITFAQNSQTELVRADSAGDYFGYALTNNGAQTTPYYYSAGQTYQATYSGDPTGSGITLEGVNASGQAVGYETPSGASSPQDIADGLVFNNGVGTKFDIPGAVGTYVLSVNNAGDFGGEYVVANADGSETFDGFVDINGVISTFASADGSYAAIVGLDDSGNLFGVSGTYGDFLATPTSITGTETIICFMAGTRIRAAAGDVAIETLNRGDLVMTTEGEFRPVRWIGRQTVFARFADPVRSWPIRVKAGALGENLPCRDLLVSPDHALLVDGLLVHAGALVNGSSIAREKRAPETFVYYHVELDDHELILAENVPAETFVDNVDRMNFDNWAEHEALYPEGRPVAEMRFPRAKARRQVPVEIRDAIDARAIEIGAAPPAYANAS